MTLSVEETSLPANPAFQSRRPYPFAPRSLVRLALGAALALALFHPFVRAAFAQKEVRPLPLAYTYVASPNYDERPADAGITCIVLHATAVPTTEQTMAIFLDPQKRVSAHFVVGKDGRVVQMVPVEKRAWHAGISVLEGVSRVNDYSVGIEIVNLNDGSDPYTEAQIQAVAGIVRLIRSQYNIPDSRIVSHAQIALPPGRKTDPLGLDFDRVRALSRINVAHPEGPTGVPPPATP